MQAVLTQRLEFAPPPTGGLVRSVALAIMAHALLLAALTWGVSWHRETPPVVVEAELWSASAMQAMARVEPPPPPAPAAPAVVTEPAPTAPAPLPRAVAPAPQVQADIALEQQRKRLKREHELELENKRLQAAEQEKRAVEARRREQQLELQRKAAADKLAREQEAQRRQSEAQENQRLEALRQENIRRMTGLAGAATSTGSSGSAQQSSGPSADYAGRIRARIRPNIAYSGDNSGNPTTLVEVRTSPDGTIIRRSILKSSGVEAWDEAVLKAIDKTEVLPRNADGKVPPLLELSIRLKD